MSDIFSEVDEEVRKDKSVELWNKYGKLVIGGSILIVAATASVVGWQNYQLQQAQTQGAEFRDAVTLTSENKFDEAAAQFGLLAKEGSAGYQALASLRQADAYIKAGKGAEALAIYDAIGNNTDIDQEFTALARIMAAFYQLNNGSTEEVRTRLSGLEGPESIWSATAKELLALADLKDGNIEKARTAFKALSEEAGIPLGIKTRAEQVLAALK